MGAKTLFFLSIFIIFFSKVSFPQVNGSTNLISVKVDITGKNNHLNECDSNVHYEEYYCTIRIVNVQDTSVKFWIMNCSWNSSFITNDDSIYVPMHYPGCDINAPAHIILKPHQSLKLFGRIISSRKAKELNDTRLYKLGFMDLSFRRMITGRDKTQYKIYWSNGFRLNNRLEDWEIE